MANILELLGVKKLQGGGKVVSQLWTEKTGLNWSEAKAKGYTNGSKADNLKLRDRLLNEDVGQSKPTTKGFQYGTPLQDAIAPQKAKVQTFPVASTKAKGLPTYQDWTGIKANNDRLNAMNDFDKVVNYHAGKDNEQYLVVDKKKSAMFLYRGDKKIDQFEVGLGKNKSDAQTTTKVVNGKTMWDQANYTTGAGTYTISGVTPKNKHYYNVPSFNMKNENGIEVSTAIHGTPVSRRAKFNNGNLEDNRMSTGCINGKCYDLEKLYKKYKVQPGTKLFVLPEDEGNRYEVVDGKLAMKMTGKNRASYQQYIDQNGNVQKGQGANYTTKTLNYKPVELSLDEENFKKKVFQWNDFGDEGELKNTTTPYVKSLQDNKKMIMERAKIPSDVYNEVAKVAFGIYGTESNFGDTHSAIGNFARLVSKTLSPKSSSSPDYMSKATTYGLNGDNRSVGLTQIRFAQLNKDEREALKGAGITSNADFLNPTKAAIGTAIVLGIRYNQQLNDTEKKNITGSLPRVWNNRPNYGDRVRANSSYMRIKQLQE